MIAELADAIDTFAAIDTLDAWDFVTSDGVDYCFFEDWQCITGLHHTAVAVWRETWLAGWASGPVEVEAWAVRVCGDEDSLRYYDTAAEAVEAAVCIVVDANPPCPSQRGSTARATVTGMRRGRRIARIEAGDCRKVKRDAHKRERAACRTALAKGDWDIATTYIRAPGATERSIS